MSSSLNDAQLDQEAQSPLTSPERLIALYEANPRYGASIARNPATPMIFLKELAPRFPCDVLANPVLEMEFVESGRRYVEFSLKELVCLCLASSHENRKDLLDETRARMASEISKLKDISEGTLSCIWRGRRSVVISASDYCDFVSMSDFDDETKAELISQANGKYPAVYDVEYRAFIEGTGPLELVGLPVLDSSEQCADSSEENCLSGFLKAVSAGSIEEFVNDYEIIRENNGDGELRISSLSMVGSLEALISSAFEFYHCIGNNKGPIEFDNGYLMIPIDACEECEREYDLELGALAELVGFQDDFTQMHLGGNWHVLLARQLCSSS